MEIEEVAAADAAALAPIFKYLWKIRKRKRECWVHLMLHCRSTKGRPEKKVFAGFGWLFDRWALHLDGGAHVASSATINQITANEKYLEPIT